VKGFKNRMSNDAAHKGWWQIFEVVLGIPFMVAIALQFVAPIPLPRCFLTPILIPGGLLLIIVGVSLAVLARREFARYHQPTDPGHPTSRIISTGVFSISRNPLYLGGIFILAGISLAFNLPWVLILLIPSIAACHYVLVAPEESYLAARFGEEYRLYTARVHRWIGRKQV
jgi:protein-S-isoprenylcysteine O-methyltransferase Ste14